MKESYKDATAIQGTHRLQDLFPAFLAAYENLDPKGVERFLSSRKRLCFALEVQRITSGETESPYFESMEANYDMEDLFDALNDLIPGYYFGSTEGDGSDFGFWKIEEVDL